MYERLLVKKKNWFETNDDEVKALLGVVLTLSTLHQNWFATKIWETLLCVAKIVLRFYCLIPESLGQENKKIPWLIRDLWDLFSLKSLKRHFTHKVPTSPLINNWFPSEADARSAFTSLENRINAALDLLTVRWKDHLSTKSIAGEKFVKSQKKSWCQWMYCR